MADNILIDPELIRQAYLNAFKGIELPEDYGEYSNPDVDPLIESRTPGAAITARIWNDTINELRSICHALAVSMEAHNRGIEDLLDEFTKEVNAVLQHLLDIDQAEFVRWLATAAITFDFTTDSSGNATYLNVSYVSGNDVVTVTSPNLRDHQIFWMVREEEEPRAEEIDPETGEPVIDPETGEPVTYPVWRIALNTDPEVVEGTLVTEGYLASHNYLTQPLGDARYALKSELGTKDPSPVTPIISNTVWGGLEEVADRVGVKLVGSSIEADNCWGALDEVYARTLSPENLQLLTELAGQAETLLGISSRIDNIDSTITSLETNIDNRLDADETAITNQGTLINNNSIKLNNSIVELLTFMTPGYADAKKTNTAYYVNKSGAKYTRASQSTPALVLNTSGLNVSKSGISVETRAGWCFVKMNLYFKKITTKINNSFIVPICELPAWLYPNVAGFDIPCESQCVQSYDAFIRVIQPENRTYTIPRGSTTQNYKFEKPTLALMRLRDGTGSNAGVPSEDFFIKAYVAYPMKYKGPKINNYDSATETVTLNMPGI